MEIKQCDVNNYYVLKLLCSFLFFYTIIDIRNSFQSKNYLEREYGKGNTF